MHVDMDMEYTPFAEESLSEDVAVGSDMHVPRAMGSTQSDSEKESSDEDATMQEQMEWRGTIVKEEPWDPATLVISPLGGQSYKPGV